MGRALAAVLIGVAALARPGGARAAPSAGELAPIVIPEVSRTQTDFASQLDRACRAVSAVKPADARLEPADLSATGDRATERQARALSAMRHACDAVNGESDFSEHDLETLLELRRAPAELAQRLEAAAGRPPTRAGPPSAFSLNGVATDVVSGLAAFLYDRARAEAILYLRQQLTYELCQPERRPFLPSTCTAFESSDLGISLQAMGSYLATAARRDLHQLPDTALVYGLHEVAASGPDRFPEPRRQAALDALFGARLGLAYYRTVAAGRNPLDVARSLHRIHLAHVPAEQLFQGVVLASQLLDGVTQQSGWDRLGPQTDPQLVRCYVVGVVLAVREMPEAHESPLGLPAERALSAAIRQADGVLRLAFGLALLARDIGDQVQAIQPPAAAPGSGDRPGPTATAPAGALRAYAALATRALHLALRDGGHLAASLAGRTAGGDARRLETPERVVSLGEQLVQTVAVDRGDPSEIALTTLLLVGELARELGEPGSPLAMEIPAAVREAIPVIAQLAQARSADEARDVIAAAAVPLNTYQTKYRKPVVALGGIVGVSGGVEAVHLHRTVWSGVAGSFAPVGFTASRPFGAGRWHLGAMLSFLNVGALVSARFTADTTTSGAETRSVNNDIPVSWVNVLTPGAFITVGVGRSPFVVGAGVQVVPSRRVEISGGAGERTSSTPGLQGQAFVGVDVPLLAF